MGTAIVCFALGIGAAPSKSAVEFSAARGLEFLSRKQRSDGSLSDTNFPVAAHALAGLAFLSAGHTPRYGTYAAKLRLGLRRLLTYQRDDGYFDDQRSRMYGHGFATLYLAQVIGMWGDPREEARIREALRRAIRLIENSQDAGGGWDYEPRSGGVSDCSITVCQTMALRAARNIGLEIDRAVVDRAFRYIRRAQTEDGGFRYRTGDTGPLAMLDRVTLGCTAAGVCILNGLGEYDSDRVRRGLDYLRTRYRSPFLLTPFFYYTHYYAGQAFYGTRGGDGEQYFTYIAGELYRLQEKDGSWVMPEAGAIEGTAMAVFILNVPTAVLPIVQR